jgi:hypothetical protein
MKKVLTFENCFRRTKFFSTVASCLVDFAELTPAAPVATFMQELSEKKTLHAEQLAVALPNLACYLSCFQYEQVNTVTCLLMSIYNEASSCLMMQCQ